MTLDFEITKPEVIENMPQRGKLGRSLISSILGHTLLFYLAVDVSTSGHVFRYVNRLINEAQKAPLVVSLHEDSDLYYGPEERVAFEPKIRQGNNVQAVKPKEEIRNSRNFGNSFQVEVAELPKELEGIVAKIPKNFEGFDYDKNLQDILTMEFNHALKPGERDEVNYIKFFLANLNSYRGAAIYQHTFEREIIPIFKRNSAVPVVGDTFVRFFKNGTFEIVFRLAPEFVDEQGKVLELHRKFYDDIPKTFISPGVAGLPSPITYIITEINPANPIAASVPIYVK